MVGCNAGGGMLVEEIRLMMRALMFNWPGFGCGCTIGVKTFVVGGFGCLELVLYGIRELA